MAQTAVARRPATLSVVRDVAALAKPRLTTLVICTAAGGMWLAPGHRDAVAAVALLVGTSLVVAAANALNNFLERDSDGQMRRTRDRPLPAGRIEPWVAVAVGLGLPSIALPALALLTNGLTATLAALALFSYVVVYTPMKQRSSLALFAGAVPGAIPPLMGWTAATGRLDDGGLALFALLFCWQLPHFLAISLYLKEDYARVGSRSSRSSTAIAPPRSGARPPASRSCRSRCSSFASDSRDASMPSRRRCSGRACRPTRCRACVRPGRPTGGHATSSCSRWRISRCCSRRCSSTPARSHP